MYFDHICD